MKKFFYLLPHTYLVDGDNGSCLYNTLTGDIIALSEANTRQLKASENNTSLDEIDNLDLTFYNAMREANIGMDYDECKYIEKATFGKNEKMRAILPDCHSIPKAQIEITSKCNLNCSFCSITDTRIYRKTGCKRWVNDSPQMSLDEWKSVLDQLKKLRCGEIAFIGGEPLLEAELFFSLVAYARSIGINNIVLYTNGTLLSKEVASILKANDVKVIIQCLSIDAAIYEQMTDDKLAFEKVYDAIDICISNTVDFKLLYLMTRYNEEEYDHFISYIQERNIKAIVEYIYPYPENQHYSMKLINKMNHHKRKLIRSTLPIFESLRHNNCCFGGVLAITSNGHVHPCILSRNVLLGKLDEHNTLVDCLGETYNELKTLTKDKVEGCSTCSQRYGCVECRAIEMSASIIRNGMVNCDLLLGKNVEKLSNVELK